MAAASCGASGSGSVGSEPTLWPVPAMTRHHDQTWTSPLRYRWTGRTGEHQRHRWRQETQVKSGNVVIYIVYCLYILKDSLHSSHEHSSPEYGLFVRLPSLPVSAVVGVANGML